MSLPHGVRTHDGPFYLQTAEPRVKVNITRDVLCMIPGFCYEVDENCTLMGCYPGSSGNNPEKHSSHPIPV